ncbi:MAG: hypothetical protein ACLGH3_04610 [Actinomycetota bacterium]
MWQMVSDNVRSAVNQQERLDSYIAGFVDGEFPSIRKRDHLHDVVVPFFEANPLLSSKHDDFLVFADIVRAMKAGAHRESAGFERLRRLALTMNGGGRYRRSHRPDTDPESSEAICQTPESFR